MLVTLQLPDPDPLPLAAPWWLFWFLLTLTFLLHLIPMNFILGGALVAAVDWVKGRRAKDGHHLAVARWIGQSMPIAVAATVTFGVAPLLFVQVLYGRALYTSSILMGWYWLAVIPVLIAGYYAAYFLAFRSRSGIPRIIWAWVPALLFLAIAFVYTNNMSLMLRPEVLWGMYVADPRGTLLNWGDLTLFPRFLHNLLSALAIAGLAISIYGLSRRPVDGSQSRWIVRHGVLIFAFATAVNFVIGAVFLLSFPRETLLDLMKSSWAGTLALALSFVFALLAFGGGILALQAREQGTLLTVTCVAAVATLVSMIVVRDQVRAIVLRDQLLPVGWEEPQWGAIVVFALLLVGAIGCVSWMVLALRKRVEV